MAQATLDSLLEQLRAAQPRLREEYGVGAFWIFGSYVHGEQGATSDLDVLVEFERPGMTLFKFIDLEQALTECVGVKVDLIQRSALHSRMRAAILDEAIAV
ncbi:MAG: nucleotidyltransferase family protein [Armatimonadetes bacterium]|nr:nucleotidyltransferase family protein [Armatimonadota bacterium]